MGRIIWLIWIGAAVAFAQNAPQQREAALKADLSGQMDGMKKPIQVMVDSVFSFGELGFQEVETSKYLTAILEKEGFTIERGVAGIPTAWVASWGSGKPVIALGSDIDCIPQASQKPGVAYHDPLIEGAPGHGEGHNSGMPLNILAALAVKKVMEREHLQGTIMLWPGVAEEQLILDPGLGFAKNASHNWALLAGLGRIIGLGLPVLVGASRKMFLGRLLSGPVRASGTG